MDKPVDLYLDLTGLSDVSAEGFLNHYSEEQPKVNVV
jgi:hypothetical protein